MKKIMKKTGFTLIELLVVIAIIGMLAAIVLVSLAGARARARDARIIADMSQLRSTAEIYFSNNNSYSNLCQNNDVITLRDDIINQGGGQNYFCEAASTDYCIRVQLNNNQWWCIDSQLRSQQYSSTTCASGVRSCQQP